MARRAAPWSLVAAIALLLAACAAGGRSPAKEQTERGQPWVSTEKSAEGPVTVTATWDGPRSGLVFRVALDTHSVNLDGYDLKRLAVLRTGGGTEVRPVRWDAPPGGHHRSGELAFPERLPDGKPVLASDVRSLTLVVRDVGGVLERRFTWEW